METINMFLHGCSDHQHQLFCLFEFLTLSFVSRNFSFVDVLQRPPVRRGGTTQYYHGQNLKIMNLIETKQVKTLVNMRPPPPPPPPPANRGLLHKQNKKNKN